ncbi:LANO_0F02454g1_1 [Lachancea nothofagi CBS 11611]|uniref:LANO_0F02454g1_1 n=1 Tax=Lachancea nothofagi CBS 11611 TaxID=1266666 RepID=A0A1G4K6Q7_9SACH|nr:LANO_0F02454g1_1 [Lachancea nothofagi CBS 11611]
MLRVGLRTLTTNSTLRSATSKLSGSQPKIPSPKELRHFLDNYVVGQTVGKKVLSVAVYNHYLRINDRQKRIEAKLQSELLEKQRQEDDKDEPIYSSSAEAKSGYEQLHAQLSKEMMGFRDEDLELSKSNVLVVGPSGSGKTLLASTLARVLDVPIAMTDCTQLTQAGYIGEDVEVCIERLLVSADYDVAKAERGIIVLDELDKLAKPAASIGTKDVSGEGVQQSLLKILEGHSVEVTVKRPVNKKKDPQNNQVNAKKDETFVVDTSNILFMLMGAFVGLDKHVAKRIKSQKAGEAQSEKDTNTEDIKRLRFSNTIEKIELPNGKKVSALNLATPTDLVSYGLIPELVGRVPIITALEPLERSDLFHILREPKNALLNQYEYIFRQFGVKLCVTEKALMKVAHFAQDEGTGARGLRGIMERLLLNVNYECPGSGISYVLVDEKTVNSLKQTEHSLATHVAAKYYSRGERDEFIEEVYKEDTKQGEILDKMYGRVGSHLMQSKRGHE